VGLADHIYLEKDGFKIVFDIQVHTKHGVLFAACMKRITESKAGLVAAGPKEIKLNVIQVHGRLGHMSEQLTRECAKELEWTIT
jgi:hypothetical protein